MKRNTVVTTLLGTLMALVFSAGVVAHGTGDGQGGRMMSGQGMMSGSQTGSGTMGPGMMGPDMMDRGMMGPGMMGRGMMGQGMMGQGMMSQGMMGPGMMHGGIGPYEAGVLGLSDEQRERLESIQRENAREHWQSMQEMHEQSEAMMELRRGEEVDPEALGRAFDDVAAIHRRMIVQQARMHNRMREVLTAEQRDMLEQMQGRMQGFHYR